MGCRSCFITADERHNLDYDITMNDFITRPCE